MIYYIILSSGLLLLLLINMKWIKIKKSINTTKKRQINYDLFLTYTTRKIFNEWVSYFITINKNKKYIVISIIYAICVYIANNIWFNINIIAVLTFILLSILAYQIRFARKNHHTLFKRDFPEVLLMINMAASSGASIHQILERCGKEVSGPLGNELNLICRRLNVGESPETVFYDSYQRFNFPEFYFLITIILLNLQQGGQLRELTSRLSQVITKSKTSEQKKAVMTAQTRMSVNIISIMPFAFSLLLYFMDPTVMESMWNHPIGRNIFYYILASETTGIILIRSMLRKAL
ncbi:Flp pilus assembly protein TadB [Yersinia aldovae]|uniref:Flp pilus assembly protein TadB n=1 Tax=Yersinia aldovae TaxID=29483 RepID=A0A0T9TKZ8_YERAL|nr:type II secretion system F family protein [Yersinia aldovae]CNJ77751.1 Flp pilus assembly protein TadB [Yersinia aldovae]CNK87538.1 Flp pilus assembly protein TadB [Yersinia aldovae]CNL33666.1 Flp pilus assembly protein TadB [Yersinia aldovae]